MSHRRNLAGLVGAVATLLILAAPATSQDEFANVRELWDKSDHEFEQVFDDILNPRIALMESLMATRNLTSDELEILGQAYLYLVHTRVKYSYWLDDHKVWDRAQRQREAATKDIDRLLDVRALCHTRPDSTDHPLLMHELFDQVRREKFGIFKVSQLDPADAWVIMGNDTLRTDPGESLVEPDLIPGSYSVLVCRDGYRPQREDVLITKGETTVRDYRLREGRSWWWWTWRGAIAAGTVTAVTLGLIPGDEAATPPPPDLPLPPGPPAR